MDINALANQISAAYTKALCQRPGDAVALNIYRALEDCPAVVRACNAHEGLVAAIRFAIPRLEQLDAQLAETAAHMECGYLGMRELDYLRTALAKAEGK